MQLSGIEQTIADATYSSKCSSHVAKHCPLNSACSQRKPKATIISAFVCVHLRWCRLTQERRQQAVFVDDAKLRHRQKLDNCLSCVVCLVACTEGVMSIFGTSLVNDYIQKIRASITRRRSSLFFFINYILQQNNITYELQLLSINILRLYPVILNFFATPIQLFDFYKGQDRLHSCFPKLPFLLFSKSVKMCYKVREGFL